MSFFTFIYKLYLVVCCQLLASLFLGLGKRRYLNGSWTDTRIHNLSLDKPSKEAYPFAVTGTIHPKTKPVEVEQPKPEQLEEVNEYEYMGRIFVKQPDGRFSFYSRSYDETKCGTLEELEAFVDAVERGDIMGSIAKWGELASA